MLFCVLLHGFPCNIPGSGPQSYEQQKWHILNSLEWTTASKFQEVCHVRGQNDVETLW